MTQSIVRLIKASPTMVDKPGSFGAWAPVFIRSKRPILRTILFPLWSRGDQMLHWIVMPCMYFVRTWCGLGPGHTISLHPTPAVPIKIPPKFKVAILVHESESLTLKIKFDPKARQTLPAGRRLISGSSPFGVPPTRICKKSVLVKKKSFSGATPHVDE